MTRSRVKILSGCIEDLQGLIDAVVLGQDDEGYILDQVQSFGGQLLFSFIHESVAAKGLSMVQYQRYNGGTFTVTGQPVAFEPEKTVGNISGLGLNATNNQLIVTKPGLLNIACEVHYVCLDGETYVISLRRAPGTPEEIVEDTKNNDNNAGHAGVLNVDRLVEVTSEDIAGGDRNRFDIELKKTTVDGGVIVDVKMKVLRGS